MRDKDIPNVDREKAPHLLFDSWIQYIIKNWNRSGLYIVQNPTAIDDDGDYYLKQHNIYLHITSIFSWITSRILSLYTYFFYTDGFWLFLWNGVKTTKVSGNISSSLFVEISSTITSPREKCFGSSSDIFSWHEVCLDMHWELLDCSLDDDITIEVKLRLIILGFQLQDFNKPRDEAKMLLKTNASPSHRVNMLV